MPQDFEQLKAVTTSWSAPSQKDIDEVLDAFNKAVEISIKRNGFASTLKHINKGKLPQSKMGTVRGGVLEYKDSGRIDAALDTDDGPVVLRDAVWTDQGSKNAETVLTRRTYAAPILHSPATTADGLLSEIEALGVNVPSEVICRAEFTQFDAERQLRVLPQLWNYILHHRNSNDTDILIAVGSAIRKYVALIPMNKIVDLAILLDPTQRVPLSADLELEVAKMVYRSFEVNPTLDADPNGALAKRLWEMAQTYLNPRLLLRDKYSAVACLSIEALIAMRGPFAKAAWTASLACPFAWFGEMVDDDIVELRRQWNRHDDRAVAWLDQLREEVVAESLRGQKA